MLFCNIYLIYFNVFSWNADKNILITCSLCVLFFSIGYFIYINWNRNILLIYFRHNVFAICLNDSIYSFYLINLLSKRSVWNYHLSYEGVSSILLSSILVMMFSNFGMIPKTNLKNLNESGYFVVIKQLYNQKVSIHHYKYDV